MKPESWVKKNSISQTIMRVFDLLIEQDKYNLYDPDDISIPTIKFILEIYGRDITNQTMFSMLPTEIYKVCPEILPKSYFFNKIHEWELWVLSNDRQDSFYDMIKHEIIVEKDGYYYLNDLKIYEYLTKVYDEKV